MVLVSDRGVVDDDRLRNWAATLAEAGALVTVLGVSPSSTRSHTAEGAVRFLEIPVRFDLRSSLAALRSATATATTPAPAAKPSTAGAPGRGGWPRPTLRHGLLMVRTLRRLWERVAVTAAARAVLTGERAGAGRPRVVGALLTWLVTLLVGLLRASSTAGRNLDQAGVALLQRRERRRAAAGGRRARRLPLRGTGWRRIWPEVADLELALGPVLDGLDADVLCASGFRVLPLVEAAATRRRAQGGSVEFLYDAREDVRRLPGRTEAERRAAHRLERDCLRGARLVFAADQVTAAGLPGRPVTVADAPSLRPPVAQPGADLRRTIGVLDGAPLLVAAAPAAAGRGLDTLVRAVALLPGVHCAVFAAREKSPVLAELRDLARLLRCGDRLHVVPPGPGRARAGYLAAATVGLHLDPAPDGDLPQAYLAYLHAGLPVVCAATGPAARTTAELEVGELVAPGDTDALVAALRAVLARPSAYGDLRARPEVLRRMAWESEDRAGRLTAAFRELLGDRLEDDAAARGAVAQETSGHRLPAAVPAGEVRTFAIGPRNGNGQPWAWTSALAAAYPAIRSEVFGVQYPTGRMDMVFPCHRSIPLADWRSLDWQLSWARHLLTDVSHLLIEQGLSACGTLNGKHFFADLPMLRAHDVTVGLVFRGSEIRNPAHHAAREPYSPFADPADDFTALLQRQVDQLRPHVDAFEGEVFVTTLDLKDDLPDATWLPHVLDVDRWAGGGPLLRGRVPVVVHAPSKEAMKGSALIDAVCQPLAAAGRIEYRRLRGIPFEQMPDTLRAADVVIDQFALGAYGVLASQALAAGRLVVGHVSDRVRARLPVELPIVEAEPATLADVLLSLLDDPDAANEQAGRGEDYVRRFHSGRYSVGQLAAFLGIEDRSGWPTPGDRERQRR